MSSISSVWNFEAYPQICSQNLKIHSIVAATNGVA